MRVDDDVNIDFPLTSEMLLLGVAIALAIIFVGLLVLDLRKRQRRRRRRSGDSLTESTEAGLFAQLRDLRREFGQMLRARARQKERRRRHRPRNII